MEFGDVPVTMVVSGGVKPYQRPPVCCRADTGHQHDRRRWKVFTISAAFQACGKHTGDADGSRRYSCNHLGTDNGQRQCATALSFALGCRSGSRRTRDLHYYRRRRALHGNVQPANDCSQPHRRRCARPLHRDCDHQSLSQYAGRAHRSRFAKCNGHCHAYRSKPRACRVADDRHDHLRSAGDLSDFRWSSPVLGDLQLPHHRGQSDRRHQWPLYHHAAFQSAGTGRHGAHHPRFGRQSGYCRVARSPRYR